MKSSLQLRLTVALLQTQSIYCAVRVSHHSVLLQTQSIYCAVRVSHHSVLLQTQSIYCAVRVSHHSVLLQTQSIYCAVRVSHHSVLRSPRVKHWPDAQDSFSGQTDPCIQYGEMTLIENVFSTCIDPGTRTKKKKTLWYLTFCNTLSLLSIKR